MLFDGKLLVHISSLTIPLHPLSTSPLPHSIDDYYLLSGTSSLAVIETSNDVYDVSAYDYLSTNSVMCWLRTMAANMLAVDGKSWGEEFSKYHSGTYNNQWMVLDATKFKEGSANTKDLFWVIEEAPGLMHSEDQTERLLKDGYWASYNVAYYEDIRERMGEIANYDTDPRANLFRNMQGNVTDLEGIQDIMTWNDYVNEPLSEGSPDNAIMMRGDLEEGRGRTVSEPSPLHAAG
jgi:hypothetical protein